MNQHQRVKLAAEAHRRAREERTEAMWRRFVEATGREETGRLSADGKRRRMKRAIDEGLVELREVVASGIEAADLGIVDFKPASSAEPCKAPPGSLAKIQVLAARAEAGCELFDPGDCPSRQLAAWEDAPGRWAWSTS